MNYIAITFGPIGRMNESVKSTKALWASSYFFSYLAKSIIASFREREFVFPIVNDCSLWVGVNGIGRFPDRYIFKSLPGDFELLKERSEEILEEISKEISEKITFNSIKDQEIKKDTICKFIKNYLKVYFFEKDCKTSNIQKECNPILDLLEMQDAYNWVEDENYFVRFFENQELYSSFLVEDAFGQEVEHFQALDRISCAEILNQVASESMAYHKYIAIINADGDNMSRTIEKLLNEGRSIQELSKKLLSFGQEAVRIVERYGARIVFLGGDDVLIFSPVKYGSKTFFSLIDDLSKSFDQNMSEFTVRPTLSFGVTVTYEKFPMGEALSLSRHLLEKAKNEERHPLKNTIAYTLQKHSGQSSSIEFEKNKKSYNVFISMLGEYINTDVLNSVTHWLGRNESILSVILKQQDNRVYLQNYFDNSFDEDVHEDMRPFLKTLIDYLSLFYSEHGNSEYDYAGRKVNREQWAIIALHAILRFIHFIKTKRDEE